MPTRAVSSHVQKLRIRIATSTISVIKNCDQYSYMVANLYWYFLKLKLYWSHSMHKPPKESEALLYEEVAAQLVKMIDNGTLAVGSRAPSVRSLSAQLKVSISTVLAAYHMLEDRGRLAARPQSGFYVRALRRENVEEPRMSRPPETASVVTVGDLRLLLLTEFGQPGIIGLGASNGAVSDWSMKAVHSLMNSISRSQPLLSAAYAPPAGMASLRLWQVGAMSVRASRASALSPDDVVTITCGHPLGVRFTSACAPSPSPAIRSPWNRLPTGAFCRRSKCWA